MPVDSSQSSGKTYYQASLEYLYSFINYEQQPGASPSKMNLDQIEALLQRLDHPERRWLSVHVAGTDGKGSTAAMIASMLRCNGYRTGLYTSPHLVSFRERITIDGEAISKEAVSRLVERLRPAVADMGQASPEAPTFFDIWTGLAFLYFAEQRVDIAVIEVGLGGRLDSTNVLNPAVSVITPIGLDHMDRLGHTLTEIAYEKAGIVKEGVPVVCGSQEPEALTVIRDTCRDRRSALYEAHLHTTTIRHADTRGQIFDIESLHRRYDGLEVSLLGEHQVANAATAIAAVEVLGRQGIRITTEGIAQGLRAVRWPGRLEIVRERPWLILDGAHNGLAARALVQAVRHVFAYRRAILIVSLHVDKDITDICSILATVADEVVVATRGVMRRRQAAPEFVAEQFRKHRIPVSVAASVASALTLADSIATPDDLICATGSLSLVGETIEVLQNLEPEEMLSR